MLTVLLLMKTLQPGRLPIRQRNCVWSCRGQSHDDQGFGWLVFHADTDENANYFDVLSVAAEVDAMVLDVTPTLIGSGRQTGSTLVGCFGA